MDIPAETGAPARDPLGAVFPLALVVGQAVRDLAADGERIAILDRREVTKHFLRAVPGTDESKAPRAPPLARSASGVAATAAAAAILGIGRGRGGHLLHGGGGGTETGSSCCGCHRHSTAGLCRRPARLALGIPPGGQLQVERVVGGSDKLVVPVNFDSAPMWSQHRPTHTDQRATPSGALEIARCGTKVAAFAEASGEKRIEC